MTLEARDLAQVMMCAADGCDNSAVPGTQFCGLEGHGPIQGDNVQDGTASPQDPALSSGLADGTGSRSDTCGCCDDCTGNAETRVEGRDTTNPGCGCCPNCTCDDAGTDGTDSAVGYDAESFEYAEWRQEPEWDEVRAKYSADDRKDMAKSGEALPDGSYPIKDASDLQNAIHAVGRGSGDHNAIRKHIMARAKALGLSKEIPDNWAADGSIKTSADLQLDRSGRRWKPRHRSTPEPRPEVRIRVSDLEVRADSGGDIVLDGTPIVYSVPYSVNDMFGTFSETMNRNVCVNVLSSPELDCRFLFNHDGMPLARTTSGTLVLTNGPNGLRSSATLDPRQNQANDLAVAIERGDITQMSVGFRVGDDEWNDDYTERTINSISDLLDVSAVTYPASPTTSIAVAQRMLQGMPVESRARVRETYKLVRDIRAGKTLSSANTQLLMTALESLHQADDADLTGIVERLQDVDRALDTGMAALSAVSGLPDPDGDEGDETVTLSPTAEHEPREGEEELETRDDEARRAEELATEEAAEKRRRYLKAQRDKLARGRRPI